MKKIVLLATMILILFAFSACAANKTESAVMEGKSSMFVKVEDGPYWNIYYHSETKVMYVVSVSAYNRGNFTVLVNPDGTPMLYDGE